jgi:hypothetical protein
MVQKQIAEIERERDTALFLGRSWAIKGADLLGG